MAKTKKVLRKGKILNRLKKLDKRTLFVILFDVLFYVTLAAIVVTATLLANENAKKVEQVMPLVQRVLPNILQGGLDTLPQQASLEEIREATTILESVLQITKIIAGGAIALIILSSLFFRSFIWAKVLKLKFSKKYFKKYFLLNICWISGWGLVLFLLAKIFKRDVILWVLGIGVVLYLYFTVILRSLFDEKKNSIDMVEQSFSIGAKKIHLVVFSLIPGIAVAALLAVLFRYLWFEFGLCTLFIMSVGVLPIIYFAWLRILMSGVVKNLQPKLKKGH